MSMFSIATLTRNHKFGVVKYHKFIIFQLWRSEVLNESAGYVLSRCSRGESIPLHFFQLLEDACILWLMVQSSIFKARSVTSPSFPLLAFTVSSYKAPVIILGQARESRVILPTQHS